MRELTFDLVNEHGLHARPAGILVQTCAGYGSQITLSKEGKTYNCKSMLKLLQMAGQVGDTLTLCVEGHDEDQAFLAIRELIDNQFSE